MKLIPRPQIPVKDFEEAIEKANLDQSEQELIDYIRFTGVFTQPSLVKDLRINSKPPVLSVLCSICRKIGNHIPEHFESIRKWSKETSPHGVRWDGDLVCSTARNIEGEPLSPESGTTHFETLVVHKEFFTGLN